MLDQSFSASNFYNILINENRKGNNLEKRFFKTKIYDKYSLVIKDLNKKIKRKLSYFIKNDIKTRGYTVDDCIYKRYKRYLRFEKQKKKNEKKIKLLELLEIISSKIQQNKFKIKLTPKPYNGKTIYVVNDTPEAYFIMKQLQYNFRKLYGIKQSNRYEIVNQVKSLLNDKFPKFIIRTDIKGFYENIPNNILIQKLNEDNLLSPESKNIVKNIIREYELHSTFAKGVGIPRGVGISAYLAEYYMRKIDEKIRKQENLTYYARYVDDIIVIFTPKDYRDNTNYLNIITQIITHQTGLSINKKLKKTQAISLIKNEDKNYVIEFLGYKFEFQNKPKRSKIEEINICLTDSKISKYNNKIKTSFEVYKHDALQDENKAYRILKNRLKYLTGNIRLVNNKSNILVGSYFSNLLLTEKGIIELMDFDKKLKWYIPRFINKKPLQDKLKIYSFYEGYTNRNYYKFSSQQIEKIIEIWKNL